MTFAPEKPTQVNVNDLNDQETLSNFEGDSTAQVEQEVEQTPEQVIAGLDANLENLTAQANAAVEAASEVNSDDEVVDAHFQPFEAQPENLTPLEVEQVAQAENAWQRLPMKAKIGLGVFLSSLGIAAGAAFISPSFSSPEVAGEGEPKVGNVATSNEVSEVEKTVAGIAERLSNYTAPEGYFGTEEGQVIQQRLFNDLEGSFKKDHALLVQMGQQNGLPALKAEAQKFAAQRKKNENDMFDQNWSKEQIFKQNVTGVYTSEVYTAAIKSLESQFSASVN